MQRGPSPCPPQRTLIVSTSYPEYPGDPAGHFVESEVRTRLERGERISLIVPRGVKPRPQLAGLELFEIAAADAFGAPGVLTRLAEPGRRKRARRLLGIAGFIARARVTAARLKRRDGAFDLAQAHWLVPSVYPALPRGIARELEVVAHGSDVELLRRAPRALARGLLRRADQRASQVRLRVVSSALLRGLHDIAPRGWLQSAQVQPCAVELTGVVAREAAREQLGVEGEMWLVVGRLIPSKRVEVALHAAELMRRARPLRVVVIGDGPQRARLQQLFPRVEFLGPLKRDVCLRWIAAADGLLSGSRSEGAPTVVREARALGVRVVCCDAGDLMRWAATDPGIRVVA